MRGDHRFDERADERLERRGGVLDERALDQPAHLLDVAVVERREDGDLVGEVLVDRADADAGNFGDAVGRDRGSAVTGEHAGDGVEDRLDRLVGAILLGAANGRHESSIAKNVSKTIGTNRRRRRWGEPDMS